MDWNLSLVLRRRRHQDCTRAHLVYRRTRLGRQVTYLNEHLGPTPNTLDETILLSAQNVHLLGNPTEAKENVARLIHLRYRRGIYEGERPFILWEPSPGACRTHKLEEFLDVMPHVNVFSPSHDDFIDLTVGRGGIILPFEPRTIQFKARKFVEAGIGPNRDGLIIVRCGAYGCFWMKSEREKGWVRGYHPPDSPMIRDVTGAGSAFLGAFAVCYEFGKDIKKSCAHGIIAASFAFEQFGLPERRPEVPEPKKRKRLWRIIGGAGRRARKRTRNKPVKERSSTEVPCREKWNGDNPYFRLGLLESNPDNFPERNFPFPYWPSPPSSFHLMV
ncbi:hypothetical protein F5Y07DRAFT_376332 [Xylaria sp. FL0933]|nr:hypothetical protein F5Y07DRAFT_376332 [Xylaria sp. FL0933]